MTEAEALRALADAIATGWDETPVIYTGQLVSPPAGEAHVRISVRDLANGGSTHGRATERRVHRRALLIAEVYEPMGGGNDSSLPALERAARFRAVLEGRAIPDEPGAEAVTVTDAATNRIGPFNGFYQVNVLLTHTYPATF